VARIDNEDEDEERRHDTRNDIETEFRTMEAAGETDAPAPETYWYEPDESHLGGAFFLVEHRPGDAPIVWDRADREELYAQWDGPSDLPSQFVDAAAEIHTLGPEDVPFLEDADPHEVVDRELDTYETIYEETKLKEEPAVEEALRWFRANKPEVPETTLVHGDFRIGNMLVDGEELSAVLDWELAQVGDPLYDLGYASTYYFAGKLVNPIERPELACSLLEREWFYDQYEKRTGREVDRDRVRYWQALSAFTMMTRGVSGAHRFREGETDDVRSAWFQYIVPGHIEDILSIVREDRT
jgi:aminoglycoside phosphotransferase (APT) family kinase protein